jgi:cytochrome c556
MSKSIFTGVVATLLCVAAAAQAQSSAVALREANFKQLGRATKAVNEELKKDAPSLTTLRAESAKILQLSRELPKWFPAGSGPSSGQETEAKAEVWSQPREFAVAAKRLQDAASVLALAKSVDQFRTGVKGTGAACKGCHDQFRLQKK